MLLQAEDHQRFSDEPLVLQVKASYKLSEDFKKGPAKPKKAKKPAAAKPKKVGTLAQAVSPAGDLHLSHGTAARCATCSCRASTLWQR